MSVRSVRALAPGKINLSMHVGPLRDDGYHDVATLYQAVSLVEEVTATEADEITVSFTGPIDTSHIPLGESNLAVRAARAVAAEAGITAGARLEIIKNVPIAGGMGGGSADAAAVLVAVDALWETNLGATALYRLGAELGADVPFALHGGTAIGLGRGDILTPVLTQGHFEWVLVTSDGGLSTPDVFRRLDRIRDENPELGDSVAEHPQVDVELLHALRKGDALALAQCIHSDLQEPALRLMPELAGDLAFGHSNGALAGIVSGSGPTLAFLAEDDSAALALVAAFSASNRNAIRALAPVRGATVL